MLGKKCAAGGIILIVAQATGCNGSRPTVTAPTEVVQSSPPTVPVAPVQLLVFTEDVSFSTEDVRDVDDQVIHFNTAGELIWATDGAQFKGWGVSGIQIRGPGPDDAFQVRFGTRRGEPRAYLGWSDEYCHCPGFTPSIVDVEVVDGRVVFKATNVPVPRT